MGEELSSFQVPVCNLFREKIVNGQVCYEADVNQYKKDIVSWGEALQKGFTFIIDTNDEYDVKNLMEKNSDKKKEKEYRSTSVYKKTVTDNRLQILLKTTSIYELI